MKVTLLNFCFEDYTVELANSLCKKVDLSLIQPHKIYEQYRTLINPSIKVFPFKKYRIRDLRNVAAIRDMARSIKNTKPDIFHVQETNDPWYDLFQISQQDLPLVTTVHDAFRHPGDGDLVPGSDLTRRVVFSRSRQLIVHGEQQRDSLAKRFPKLANRINIVPHGELGSLYQRYLKSDQSLERSPNTLLFFGRIWPYKGLEYLLKAMLIVIQQVPDAKLIIAGRGETLDQYAEILSDRKHFTVLNHFIPMEEVSQLFLQSTAVILPYIEASHSGVASIALGLGTPVIASNIGGFQETIHHESDGLLVPPCDETALARTIIRLLKDPQLQNNLISSGKSRCDSDLSWDYIAAETLNVYHKALAWT